MAIVGLCLTACSTLDLRGAWAARNLEPNDVDARTARVAVIWPEGFVSNKVNLSWDVKDDTSGELIKREAFSLLSVPSGDISALKIPRADNQSPVTVYALPATELERAKAFQSYMTPFANGDMDDTTVTFAANFDFANADKDVMQRYCDPREDTPLYIWYKYRADQPYRRIIRTDEIGKFLGGNLFKSVCTDAAAAD